MAGFADLISKAIADQGAQHDVVARSRIYASSRAALKRMLAANSAITPDAAEAQWTKLDTAIDELETAYSAAPPPPAPEPAPAPGPPPVPRTNPTLATPSTPPDEPRVTPPPPMPPSVSTPQRLEPVPEPIAPPAPLAPAVPDVMAAAPIAPPVMSRTAPSADETGPPPVAPVDAPPAYRGNALKTRRPYAKWLAWIIILTGLGVAAWWAWTFGPQLLRETVEQRVGNPQSTISRGPFDPGEGWISVFDPAADPTAIVTENRGTAELISQPNGTIARLRSSNPGTSGNLLIRVPPGIVQQIRGKAATFEIVMAAPADGDQEVAIYCRFDAMGSCGRKRLAVGKDNKAQIFDVLSEDVDLPAGREAYIAINSDLGGKDRSIDVAGIRVRTGD